MVKLFEPLDWDSNFFGFPIARVSREGLGGARAWCEQEAIACAYLLLDSNDSAGAREASEAGFRFVDIRLTLELTKFPPLSAVGPRIRPATAADVDELAAIARYSHTDSRFYFDGRFEVQRCGDLYEEWIRKSCLESYADIVYVAVQDGRPAGYITCTANGGTGHIGLIAVADWTRGAGHGSNLLRASMRWFAGEAKADTVRVVTQGRNVAAQRLYQRCGFTTAVVELWYHRWDKEEIR